MKSDFNLYFNYYLDQLEHEIKLYDDEASLWVTTGDTKNSAANLVLHIIGNLNYFIGTALGNTGYKRDRDSEFETQNISKAELIERIEHTRQLLSSVIPHINNLTDPFPEGFWKDGGTIHNQLLKLLSHLAYHAGQVNYHRRSIIPN